MSVERILQIQMALLISLGGVLFGLAEGDWAMLALAAGSAFASVVFTDALGWFRLNRLVANLGSLTALFFSLDTFLVGDSRIQLTAIARLLVYLQVLILFQRKNSRLYGQLTVLSLLQVVVSAALNAGVGFALLLVVYAAAAIATMCVFFVYREIVQSAPAGSGSPAAPTRLGTADLLASRPEARGLAGVPQLSKRILDWGLARHTAAITLATFVFALVLFYAVPRTDGPQALSRQRRAVHVTGFAHRVQLEELAAILDSKQPVMRVSFHHPGDQTPYRIIGDPYYRGSVLTEYVRVQGVPCWRQRGQSPVPGIHRTSTPREWRLPEPPATSHLVRQDVVLQPLDTPVLFGVHPMYALPHTPRETFIDPATEQVSYLGHDGPEQMLELRFASATTAFLGGLQVEITPHRSAVPNVHGKGWLEREKRDLLQIDRTRFPALTRIAEEIVRQQRSQGGGTVAIAKALRDHFLTPGAYTYTTRLDQIPRQRGLDPLEDFVANHRQGHCEYFASALVMMLRSQGIPARLVIGYQGGAYNALGGYYQVVQGDAHAWVEAYLEPEVAADELPAGADVSPTGGWLRLEPTPGVAAESGSEAERGTMDTVDDMLDYARTVWSDYVLGLSARRRHAVPYESAAVRADLNAWESLLDKLTGGGESSFAAVRGPIFRWAALITLVGLSAGVVRYLRQSRGRPREDSAVTRAVRNLSRRLGVQQLGLPRKRGRTAVDFYRRFEDLLGEQGWTRSIGETPAEFVARVSQRMPEHRGCPTWNAAAGKVVEAFYRVRFGRYVLPEGEVAELDHALARLRDALQAPHA